MDPLTHTLAGASLASTRLGASVRRGTVALVVGANLPDVDVFSYFAGSDAALGFRRGWTHGVLAMALLPLLLAGLLAVLPAGRKGEPGGRPSFRRLWPLCQIAVLSHPLLDWLNTYGVRLGMPFDGSWYYGDSVFIMDPWLWLILGTTWLAGRKATPWLLFGWAITTLLLLAVTLRRAPQYWPLVSIILAALLLAALWRPITERGRARVAVLGLTAAALFVLAMVGLHALTERAVRDQLVAGGQPPTERLMVGPRPANPLAWEFVALAGSRLRHGYLTWPAGRIALTDFAAADARADDLWPRLAESRQIPGFLGWVRFPWLITEPGDSGHLRVRVLDARYTRRVRSGFGGAEVLLPEAERDAAEPGAGNRSARAP